MRKLFLMLAVLLLASAAYAVEDVNVYCTADGNVVTVSYSATADANLPRAFGLDIKLSNAETITSVTPLSPEPNGYWVYPGSYDETPETPVGDPCDSDDTLPGIDHNGITIEMGSLHSPTEANSPNAPRLSGDLFKFTVSGDCNVTISGNAARGKVVFYDAKNEDDGRDVVYTVCTVVLDCFPGNDPKYDQWVTQHKPKAWCCDGQADGDATGDGKSNVLDLFAVKKGYGKNFATGPWGTGSGEYNCAADFNHDGNVNVLDLFVVKQHYGQTVGTACADISDCPSGP